MMSETYSSNRRVFCVMNRGRDEGMYTAKGIVIPIHGMGQHI